MDERIEIRPGFKDFLIAAGEALDAVHDLIIGSLVAMGIASFGGLVNWLRKIHRKNWWTLLCAIGTAAFSGLLSHLLTSWLELDLRLQFCVAGGVGYSGGAMLDKLIPLLTGMVQRRVNERAGIASTATVSAVTTPTTIGPVTTEEVKDEQEN